MRKPWLLVETQFNIPYPWIQAILTTLGGAYRLLGRHEEQLPSSESSHP